MCNLEFTIKLRYIMGKGDKKSKRGKIIRGSFGVRRKRKAKKIVVAEVPQKAVKTAEKAVAPATAASEVKAAKPVKTAKPKAPAKSAAKPAAKKTEQEPGTVTEKAAKPAAKAKKPAAKKTKKNSSDLAFYYQFSIQ